MALHDPHELIETLCAYPRETEWFEFKASYFEKSEVGEYVSALANSAILHDRPKAYLIFGIDDKSHDVVGTDVRLKNEKVGQEIFENWLNRSLDPQINISFESVLHNNKHVEIITIEPSYQRPVKFNGASYIRIDSVKQKLSNFPQIERSIWEKTGKYSFEEGIASYHLSASGLFEQFYLEHLAKRIYEGKLSRGAIIDKLVSDGYVIDNLQGRYDVTNLLAIACAKNIKNYKLLFGKTPRVVQYKESTRIKGASFDREGARGYVVTFDSMLDTILERIPSKEVMKHGIREKEYAYPEIALRELIANALIHQDFTERSGRPLIEIFSDKIQITNPGEPLVETDRFIDSPSKTRNPILAQLMRIAGLCEVRGSGVDRALDAIERQALPPPLFQTVEGYTVVTIYRPRPFPAMTKEERIRACYQHTCLRFLANEPMSNSSLRARLGLPKTQISQVSVVIRDSLDAGLIRPYDVDQGNRKARYVPFWAV